VAVEIAGPARQQRGGSAAAGRRARRLLALAVACADKITIVDAIVPLAFAGLLHAAWARRPAGQRLELSLAVAAGAAVITAGLLLTLIGRAGGFTLLPVQTALATPGGVPGHLPLA
jgi:hypothetical protein